MPRWFGWPFPGLSFYSTQFSDAIQSAAHGAEKAIHVLLRLARSTTGSPYYVGGGTMRLTWKSANNAAVNILTDVLIMCLPISMVLKLNLPTKQKFGVSCVFALGIIVIITSSTSSLRIRLPK